MLGVKSHVSKSLIVVVVICLLYAIFTLLAFKNPFSVRSLIPNLEPYPDTLYYSTPAWNFVQGRGFRMAYNNLAIKEIYPPLYSLYLIPFFAVFRDVRSYYLANMLLMYTSIALYVLLLRKIFPHKPQPYLLILTVGFLFVTNFYVYTLPTLLMAENITLCLFLLALYLHFAPVTVSKTVAAGFMGVLLLLVKLSNLPLAVLLYLFYTFKVIRSNQQTRWAYAASCTAAFVIATAYFTLTHFFVGHINLQHGAGFALSFFAKNSRFYLHTLAADNTRFLWFTERFISPLIFTLGSIGVIIGVFSKHFRKLTLQLLAYVSAQVLFMSFFFDADARHVFSLIPTLYIFVAITVYEIRQRIPTAVAFVSIGVLLITYLGVSGLGYRPRERLITTLKMQVGLNFRHTEDPWNYLAVQKFNEFFKKHPHAYLGTVLPPFYMQYFSNGSYAYLPLTKKQDFFWGKNDLAEKMQINSIDNYYTRLLKQHKKIYITNYYVNSLAVWQTDFDRLAQIYSLNPVMKDCYDRCNLYELRLKE